MIVAAAVAVALGLLALDAYLINHLPLDLGHTVAELLLAAVAVVVATAETERARRASRTTTNGDTQ